MAGPAVNLITKGAAGAPAGLMFGPGHFLFTGTAAPTDGTTGTGAGWAETGSLYVYQHATPASSKLYINGGTKASPAWKVVTSA